MELRAAKSFYNRYFAREEKFFKKAFQLKSRSYQRRNMQMSAIRQKSKMHDFLQYPILPVGPRPRWYTVILPSRPSKPRMKRRADSPRRPLLYPVMGRRKGVEREERKREAQKVLLLLLLLLCLYLVNPLMSERRSEPPSTSRLYSVQWFACRWEGQKK